MKCIIMIALAMLGPAAVAAPGFVFAKFSGSPYDGTSDVWTYSGRITVEYPSWLYTTTSEETTTYVYGTYMYLKGGIVYGFKAAYDDFSSIKVDNRFVVPKNSAECKGGIGYIQYAEDGWHKVELRAANNTLIGGTSSYLDNSFAKGFYYRRTGSAWRPFTVRTDVEEQFATTLPSGYVVNSSYAWFRSGDHPWGVQIISSSIRDNDPTVMDVVYKVISGRADVKVRVLAFEDGTRSFAKVVRPETFIDNTAPANWDAIAANVTHTLSWKVSADWATRLAKMRFEVLVCEEDLLPLELRTIPASGQYGKMKISWNTLSDSQVFDALLWLYADREPGLTLTSGNLYNAGTRLASGTNLDGANSYYDENGSYVGSHFVPNANAARYVLGKMGYSLLEGTPLNYANSETRLGLKPYGTRQYAYQIVEE